MCGKAKSAQFSKKDLRRNNDNLKNCSFLTENQKNVNSVGCPLIRHQATTYEQRKSYGTILIFVSPSEKYSFSEEEFYREIEFE